VLSWEGCRRKWQWPVLGPYPGILLNGLGKPTENISEQSWCLGALIQSRYHVTMKQLLCVILNFEQDSCEVSRKIANIEFNQNLFMHCLTKQVISLVPLPTFVCVSWLEELDILTLVSERHDHFLPYPFPLTFHGLLQTSFKNMKILQQNVVIKSCKNQ